MTMPFLQVAIITLLLGTGALVGCKGGDSGGGDSSLIIGAPSEPLNDTGITACADNAAGTGATPDNDLDCAGAGATQTTDGTDADGDLVPAGQDALAGRDAEALAGTLTKTGAGDAGFDFTKLDANGDALPASAISWSCVQDNVTGLIWEIKSDTTPDSGLRDKDYTYTSFNTDTATNGGDAGTANGGLCTGSNCDTQSYVAAVNALAGAGRLCGADDWRLPTVNELLSIAHLGKVTPAIDTAFFPNSLSGPYWTSSAFANFAQSAWLVNFLDGGVSAGFKSNVSAVRLVRAGQ